MSSMNEEDEEEGQYEDADLEAADPLELTLVD
jgi:hypothetical protein